MLIVHLMLCVVLLHLDDVLFTGYDATFSTRNATSQPDGKQINNAAARSRNHK